VRRLGPRAGKGGLGEDTVGRNTAQASTARHPRSGDSANRPEGNLPALRALAPDRRVATPAERPSGRAGAGPVERIKGTEKAAAISTLADTVKVPHLGGDV